ncbi:MAG: 50S ribosomal protein L18Ae [Infirmifilum sp.]|jgi:large subunit ribosomal protein LX|uniref:Large ribosomal subunit protein eL20 n=1 Tax=Infirmifilum uzonense TaxID=1550241 RepID=A0A0F7FIS6_9CREN|nr:50S ribosomal protein L18Ae [Infirmifilum uzonense]AKG39167.1 hypothetical protein MA03_07880 [Infirmifilum uzonense]
MAVRTFEVTGEMKLRLGERRKFRIYLRGLGEKDVLEKLYSLLGSRHKVTRNHVKITGIREVSPDDVEDVYVKALAATDRVVLYA